MICYLIFSVKFPKMDNFFVIVDKKVAFFGKAFCFSYWKSVTFRNQ